MDLKSICEIGTKEYEILYQDLKKKFKKNIVIVKLIDMIDDYYSLPEYGSDIINEILNYIKENNLQAACFCSNNYTNVH